MLPQAADGKDDIVAQRKKSLKPADALRVRLTLPPDGIGLLDYLKGIGPGGLNVAILQLVHQGYQIQKAMSTGAIQPFGHLSMPIPEAAPLNTLAQRVSPTLQQAPSCEAAKPLEEGASVPSPFTESFKATFAPAYERTRTRKAVT